MGSSVVRPDKHAHAPRLALILADALWLLALALYAFAGMNLVPLHGDEPEHLYSSRDFTTYFVEGNPGSLAVEPPYPADSDSYIRIQTGTLTDYLFGLGWYMAGYYPADLPVTWTWWKDYKENAALGAIPEAQILAIGRAISTGLFAISTVALFGLVRQIDGRWLAFLVSGLYAVNPIILVNARRAMTEGAFLCFGLMTEFIALTIVRRQMRSQRIPWARWVGLGICAALAIAAKFSGIIFVAVAVVWIAISALARSWRDRVAKLAGGLMLTAFVCGLVYMALTPSLWCDPVNRFGDLIGFHKAVLDGIAADVPSGATTLPERVGRIVLTPFIMPPTYFEAPSWARFPVITHQVNLYNASWLHGVEPGPKVGGTLTGLVLAGLISLFLPRLVRVLPFENAAGLALWYAAMVANSLVNPLRWDRYDMLMTPISIILVGIGIWQIAHMMSRTGHSIVLKKLRHSM